MVAVVLAALLLALPPHTAATIPTGKAPCGAATGFGAVWLAADEGGVLDRIDPRTNRVTRRVVLGRGACATATGAKAVWVVDYHASTLARIDPRTFRVRKVRVDKVPYDVLVAFGRIWVTGWEDGVVDEIDPATLRIVRRIDVGPRPNGLAARRGFLWVGLGREETSITRIDPATGVVTSVRLGVARPSWFAAGAPDLWITANDSDLLHVDPVTGMLLARLHVGATLAQAAVAPDGTLWVPDKERSVVFRIDRARERVIDSFPAGPGAYLALNAFGSMWVQVLSYAGADVRRIAP
jgi:streptogramin lyase